MHFLPFICERKFYARTHQKNYATLEINPKTWDWRSPKPEANGRNNSQQCWDLHCIMGRIRPMRTCVMRVRGLNNVQEQLYKTDPTFSRCAPAITEQKKCCELLANKVASFFTGLKNCATFKTSASLSRYSEKVTNY